jgi:hypothetical protein
MFRLGVDRLIRSHRHLKRCHENLAISRISMGRLFDDHVNGKQHSTPTMSNDSDRVLMIAIADPRNRLRIVGHTLIQCRSWPPLRFRLSQVRRIPLPQPCHGFHGSPIQSHLILPLHAASPQHNLRV